MSYYDQEAIDSERLDADIEMAELEAAGRSAARRVKRAHSLREQGRLAEAAAICPHGWTRRYEPNPEHRVCYDCGSVISYADDTRAAVVVMPCVEWKRDGAHFAVAGSRKDPEHTFYVIDKRFSRGDSCRTVATLGSKIDALVVAAEFNGLCPARLQNIDWADWGTDWFCLNRATCDGFCKRHAPKEGR